MSDAAVNRGTHLPVTSDFRSVVRQLRSIAVGALPRMFRASEGAFVHCLRAGPAGVTPEGVSLRYTATVLVALAGEDDALAGQVLAGTSTGEVCRRLLDRVDAMSDLGEVALTLWAARALRHPDASKALHRLRQLDPVHGRHRTVEVAWSLTALAVAGSEVRDAALADAIAGRLLASFRVNSGLFPHWPWDAPAPTLRSHVTCFADFVYPIQALSHYFQSTGDERARDVAVQCAGQMCALQGPDGQWWWHFDARTGRVVERYPVYSVHQDAMAPMALFAIEDACGVRHDEAVRRGLRWLIAPADTKRSLVDPAAGIIWRKVARRDPAKLVRGMQAVASHVHPALRVPGVDLVFPAGTVDWESRPYHMGWILYAWSGHRATGWPAD